MDEAYRRHWTVWPMRKWAFKRITNGSVLFESAETIVISRLDNRNPSGLGILKLVWAGLPSLLEGIRWIRIQITRLSWGTNSLSFAMLMYLGRMIFPDVMSSSILCALHPTTLATANRGV